MKFKKLIFFSLIFAIYACSTKDTSTNATIVWEKFENGNFKIIHEFLTDTAKLSEDYHYKEYYKNGNLKTNGLENRGMKKGDWKFYFDNGNLNAELSFVNSKINGPITIYNLEGGVAGTDFAENGFLKRNNNSVIQFVTIQLNSNGLNAEWTDSLNILIDSLQSIKGQ